MDNIRIFFANPGVIWLVILVWLDAASIYFIVDHYLVRLYSLLVTLLSGMFLIAALMFIYAPGLNGSQLYSSHVGRSSQSSNEERGYIVDSQVSGV